MLALSFARIFYRNSVDGAFLLPIEIGQDAYSGISDGNNISVDVDGGTLTDHTASRSYPIKPFPEIIRRIIDSGGLFGYDPE